MQQDFPAVMMAAQNYKNNIPYYVVVVNNYKLVQNLEFIKEYIKENNLDSEVKIIGALCENKCNVGPRIIIDNKEYHQVNKYQLEELLKELK